MPISSRCTCCSVFTFALFIIFAVITLMCGLNYYDFSSYYEEQCFLSKVNFPSSIPQNNNRVNFIECDCGRRCVSDLGTCISLFGSPVYWSESVLIYENPSTIGGKTSNTQCTFAETNCHDGESHSDRLNAIQKAVEKSTPYKNDMLNNNTITCFINSKEHEIYLNVDVNNTLNWLIGFACITLIVGIILICSLRKTD